MASSTTAGFGQPTTALVVTATAGGPAINEDRFDPFLPALEPAVDELSLQQSMDVNKESLKRRLMLRRSVAELADQGIYPPLKTPPAFAEQRKQLEMAKTGDLLRKKLTSRPDRQCLVQHHILEDTNPLVDSCVQERQRQLKRCRLQENLSDHLVHRPGPLDLVHANILKLDPELFGADAGVGEDDSDIWSSLDEVTSGYLQDESYEGSQSSPTSLVAGTNDFMPLYDQDDSFSPLSSTSPGSQSSTSMPSVSATQCQQEIPIPPDISPLLRSSRMSTNEQIVSRVPTPPDITPLLKGALSSANIQLPLVSAQPSSMTQAAASKSSSVSRSNVSKKSRPKIGTKSKVIKFHQYLGPKNLQQQLEPCASSSTTTADTPFNILLQQQQMLLRWQLEFQQKNMQFLLSVPSNDPPKPAPAKLAVSTPSPQTTSMNIAAKPSASIAAVNPALAVKRNRLEEMKVTELRDECRRLNIARSGPKPVLIDRLLPYADDILSGNRVAAATENNAVEQSDTSSCSVNKAPALSMSNNDASTDPNILFSMQQQQMRMTAAENSSTTAMSCNTSAVPMDVDGVLCKQEPKTPDIAQPNVYPMMFMPASNSGHVVQASVSSAVPPLIVFHPTAQTVVRSANPAKQFPRMPPSLQEQILLEQQRHINDLEHHLRLSQQELMRAQQQAQIQRILQSDASPWMNNAALNGSSMSASVSPANSRVHASTTAQLHRTNSLLDTSSASAFDNKLRRTMTSPYISTTADTAVDSNCRSLSSFAYTVPVHESLPSVRNGTIDDVLDVLISSGDLPPTAADTFHPQASQVTSTVASCCPMYFLPNAAGVPSTSAVLPHERLTSVAPKQLSAGDVSDSMEWFSGDSNQLPRTVPDGLRIDMLDPTELVDFSGLLPKSSAGCDLGSVDMSDWLDDILQPGCGMSGDYMNLADDCDLCSPADGVRATFEKLMEVSTSKS